MAETEPGVGIALISRHQFAKDFFGKFQVAGSQRFLSAIPALLFVSGRGGSRRRDHANKKSDD